jgi:hypothetical protein
MDHSEENEITSTAKRQVHALTSQVRKQASKRSVAQRDKAVSKLRSVADDFRQMAGSSKEEQGWAHEVVRRAADRVEVTSEFVEGFEPTEVGSQVREYARSHPAGFFFGMAGVGLAAGRMVRSMRDAANGQGEDGDMTVDLRESKRQEMSE